MVRKRPHKHYRTIKTNKGRKRVLINRQIKRRVKRRMGVYYNPKTKKTVEIFPIRRLSWHDAWRTMPTIGIYHVSTVPIKGIKASDKDLKIYDSSGETEFQMYPDEYSTKYFYGDEPGLHFLSQTDKGLIRDTIEKKYKEQLKGFKQIKKIGPFEKEFFEKERKLRKEEKLPKRKYHKDYSSKSPIKHTPQSLFSPLLHKYEMEELNPKRENYGSSVISKMIDKQQTDEYGRSAGLGLFSDDILLSPTSKNVQVAYDLAKRTRTKGYADRFQRGVRLRRIYKDILKDSIRPSRYYPSGIIVEPTPNKELYKRLAMSR